MSEGNANGKPAVLTEVIDSVLLVTINRPEAMNAINAEVSSGLGEALERAEADSRIRAAVLTGAGDRSFSAGADLKAASRGESLNAPDHDEWGFAGWVEHPISKPTIAAVNGYALGGGTELVLACDLALSLQGAEFGLPEVKRGVYAGAGGAMRMPRQLPRKVALELILTGDAISAADALRLGLINRVVEDGVVEAAIDLARRIAANAPLSVQVSKLIASRSLDGDEPGVWEFNHAEGARLQQSHDFQEGLNAFAEKREPVWEGR
jgi:crotonobetainyl-CoA hydratase